MRQAICLALLLSPVALLAAGDELARLEEIGREIYARDQAAWRATDRVFESTSSPPPDIRGWITLPEGSGWRVRFVEPVGNGYCSRLSVEVHGAEARTPVWDEGCLPLSERESQIFRARTTALAALETGCSERYNSVVLPAEDGWTVYLLAATTGTEIVIGGHARVSIDGHGTEVLELERLSRSCLNVDTPTEGERKFAVASHVLDDHPIETHVFLSLQHQIPFLVMTETTLWTVDSGVIVPLLEGEEFEAYLEKARASGKN